MKQWTDRRLESFADLEGYVQNENGFQLMKWGIQTHSPFEWMCYLTEEVGELAKAIAEAEYRAEDKREIVREAIQVATLALKIAEMAENEK